MQAINKLIRKDFFRLGGLVAIAVICIYLLWDIGTSTQPRSGEYHFFRTSEDQTAKMLEFKKRKFPEFHKNPEILKTIRDDAYLQREAFFYLFHQMLEGTEKEIEALSKGEVNWQALSDVSKREEMRGEVFSIKGTIMTMNSFDLGKSGECYIFRENDIEDFKALVVRLRDMDFPLSLCLYNRFSSETRNMLDRYNALSDKRPDKSLQKALIHELNDILDDSSFYDSDLFAQIALSNETKMLAKTNPKGRNLRRLNRILLQEAYPRLIVESGEAETRGLKGYPAQWGEIYKQEHPYMVFFSEPAQNIRQYDRVEALGAFLKVWTYDNRYGKKQRSFVFIAKKLRFLSSPKPASNSMAWWIFVVLGVAGLLLAGAILYERREKRVLLQKLKRKKH